MLNETVEILLRELPQALLESGIMLFISALIGIGGGLILGLALYLTEQEDFYRSPRLFAALSAVINAVRSIPFIILVVFSLPFTFFITGTKIGPIAAAVPLSICALAFYARVAETALLNVPAGEIEAALACGAPRGLIIRGLLLTESAPELVRGASLTFISLIGFSAMAGMVGGGGIGNLAIQYGYYRYESGVMLFTIVFLVLCVQAVQYAGDRLARRLSH